MKKKQYELLKEAITPELGREPTMGEISRAYDAVIDEILSGDQFEDALNELLFDSIGVEELIK